MQVKENQGKENRQKCKFQVGIPTYIHYLQNPKDKELILLTKYLSYFLVKTELNVYNFTIKL